ncbi:MAG TPA: hypothetical protein VHB72_04435 [Candidatus Saccharimonadales bacterium]|nr:hypothetical protein [Candidatus Saccharimonadales bacterium]
MNAALSSAGQETDTAYQVGFSLSEGVLDLTICPQLEDQALFEVCVQSARGNVTVTPDELSEEAFAVANADGEKTVLRSSEQVDGVWQAYSGAYVLRKALEKMGLSVDPTF